MAYFTAASDVSLKSWGTRMRFKEIIVPTGANRFLFVIAPVMAMAPALAAWAVVPFTPELVLADIDASLLYIMAITSMGVYGVVLTGIAIGETMARFRLTRTTEARAKAPSTPGVTA